MKEPSYLKTGNTQKNTHKEKNVLTISLKYKEMHFLWKLMLRLTESVSVTGAERQIPELDPGQSFVTATAKEFI